MKASRVTYIKECFEDFERLKFQLKPKDLEWAMRSIYTPLTFTQNFLMPAGGRIFNDNLKGLPEIIRLPFPSIALLVPTSEEQFEAQRKGDRYPTVGVITRRIIICQEHDGYVYISCAVRDARFGRQSWTPYPAAARFKNDAISHVGPTTIGIAPGSFDLYIMPSVKSSLEQKDNTDYNRILIGMNEDLTNVLELVEALSCTNVYAERAEVPERKKGRDRLPYDSYHTLKVRPVSSRTTDQENVLNDSLQQEERNSPREHLRRGHIHTYHTRSGPKKLWVNAVVVNPGKGGFVDKDYQL